MPTRTLLALALAATNAAPAPAAFIAYDTNPTGNSVDWTNGVTALGGVVNSTVNFNTHPLGTLQPNFYAAAGVTFSSTGSPYTVVNGAGPGQGNTTAGPFSPGEGVHPVSNYLSNTDRTPSLTITFATPVFGAGLFLIDVFNPNGGNDFFLEAYSGPNGAGSLIGQAGPYGSFANFQQNKLLFIGVSSSAGDIRSVTFRQSGNPAFDQIGLDDVRFAAAPGAVTTATPLPPTALALGAGLSLLAGLARRRSARPAAA